MRLFNFLGLIICWVLAISLLTCGGTNAESDSTQTQYDAISRAVVRLEHTDTVVRAGQEKVTSVPKSDGTGFVTYYNQNLYLVTARHVVDKPYDLRTRVTVERMDNNELEVVELRIPKEAWVYHPKGETPKLNYVDVAAVKLSLKKERIIKIIPTSLIEGRDPLPPELIIVYGYPGDVGFEQTKQKPIARGGTVASEAGDKFKNKQGKFFNEQTFLLDVLMFPGNSGSPVFRRTNFDASNEIIGIVTSANERLDFAICEPVSRIRETLDYAAKKRIPRNKSPTWHLLP